MNVRNVAYWGTTGLVGVGFAVGGLSDLARSPEIVAAMSHLGYPVYFLTILGAWKLLGAAALLAPRFPRLKEWAYAGMFFDLTGAAASHAASSDPVAKVVTPLVLLALVIGSWALRPESRKLPARATSAATPRALRREVQLAA
jgi:uncharacterized membrane protein YphA (DoxX/SURF4 family)